MDDEEDVNEQGPLAITQGLGEDIEEEGVEQEEAKEAEQAPLA